MEDTSIPYKTAASAPSTQQGSVYIWLGGNQTSGSYSYLEILINSQGNPKFVAKVYQSWLSSDGGGYYKATIPATAAMNVRCIRNF